MSNFDRRLPNGWKIWPAATDLPHKATEPQSHGGDDEGGRPSNQRPQAEPRWQRELDQITGTSPVKTRSIPLRKLVPLLIHAEKFNRTWMKDFDEDVVMIDADLHDVLMAYGKLHLADPSNEQAA